MKRVFLYAYDQVNLGDDLFIHTIAKRYPQVQFYIWSSAENKKVFQTLRNLKIINKNSKYIKALYHVRPSFVARYKEWWEHRCNAVVYIGGSIFIEYETWPQMLNWWRYMAENYPFYILGANFGPYQSEDYRNGLSKVFDRVKDVCFRDIYSYKLFEDCHSVRYAPDILYSYPIPRVKIKKNQIFVSVIDCARKRKGIYASGELDEHYIHEMAYLLENYIQDGYEVVLASFCKAEGDERAIEKILNIMNEKCKEKCRKLFYRGNNTANILQAIAESEYILASRFHAVILGTAAQRPVFPMVYSDKTTHVLESVGFCGNYIDIRQEKRYDYEFSKQNLIYKYCLNTAKLEKQAQEHFRKLDELLCS